MSVNSAALNPAVTAGGGAAAAPVGDPLLATAQPQSLDQAIAGLTAAVQQLTAVVQQLQATVGGGAVQPAADAVAGGGQVGAAPTATPTQGAEQAMGAPAAVPEAPAAAPAAPAPAPAAEKPIYPVAVDPITDEFGATSDRANAHGGLDLGQGSGTEIHAALSGTVIEAKDSGGWGNQILIDHHNGLFTRYAHQSEMIATVGQEVKQGDVIGKVGSTGNSTGPHLHFEVMEGGTAASNRRDPHVWLDSGVLTAEANPGAAH